MFGLLKKMMPGAQERFLSPEEAREADAWREMAQGGQFDAEREVRGLTERQLVMLSYVTQYAVQEKGRLLMPMERFGIIGFMGSQVSAAMPKLKPADFEKMRETMIKVYAPMVEGDRTGDLKGLFFDVKFKYEI